MSIKKVVWKWFFVFPWTFLIKPVLVSVRNWFKGKLHHHVHVKWNGMIGFVFGKLAQWKFVIVGILTLIIWGAWRLAKLLASESLNWNLAWVVLPIALTVLIITKIVRMMKSASSTPVSNPSAQKNGNGSLTWKLGWLVLLGLVIWLGFKYWPEYWQGSKVICARTTELKVPALVDGTFQKQAPVVVKGTVGRIRSVSGTERRSYRLLFTEKDDLTMSFVVFSNVVPNLQIAEITLSKTGKDGWEWFGVWNNSVNNDGGYIRLKEVPGKDGREYTGWQTADGHKTDLWTTPTVLEIE